jgi:cell division septal protein FtsQ
MRSELIERNRSSQLIREFPPISSSGNKTSYFNLKVLFKLIITAVVIFIIIYFLLKAIVIMGIIKINSIEISGNHSYDDNFIMSSVGIKPGDSLGKVSKNRMNDGIKDIPGISKIEVNSSLMGDVKIKVFEREVLGLVIFNKKIYPLTEEGYILTQNNYKLKSCVPVITGKSYFSKKEVSRIRDKELIETSRLLKEIKKDLPVLFSLFEYVDIKKKEIVTIDGIKIYFDNKVDIKDFQKLAQIYTYSLNNDIKSLDLRYEYGIVGRKNIKDDQTDNKSSGGEKIDL